MCDLLWSDPDSENNDIGWLRTKGESLILLILKLIKFINFNFQIVNYFKKKYFGSYM